MDGELNDAQYEFCTSETRETYLIGGYGLGKSFALGCLGYEAVDKAPGSVTLITSPTYDTLRGATMKQIIDECWGDKFGFVDGIHYVINQLPPASWGVAPYSKLSNVRVVTWRNGSYTVLDTLENYHKHVGAQYDRILVDEFQNCTPEARKFLIGRLRGKKMQEAGYSNQIFYALTPPDDPATLEHLSKLMKDLKPSYANFVRGSSYMNKDNLAEGYIEGLLEGLDDVSIQRFIYGELVEDVAGRFAYGFKEAKHVNGVATYSTEEPIHLWFDFNLGVMACLVVQLSEDYCYVIDEFPPEKDIDIDVRCERILASPYAEALWSAIITGDPAKGRTGINANVDYYVRIIQGLDIDENQLKIRKNHPFIKSSRQLINTMFNRFKRLYIHPRCVNLIEDLKFCSVDEKGELDKSNPNRTHYLDAFRYGIDMNFIWFLAKKDANRYKESEETLPLSNEEEAEMFSTNGSPLSAPFNREIIFKSGHDLFG